MTDARKRPGTMKLCDMPGDGEWNMVSAMGRIIAVSVTHGAYWLEVAASPEGLTGRWEKIEIGAAP